MRAFVASCLVSSLFVVSVSPVYAVVVGPSSAPALQAAIESPASFLPPVDNLSLIVPDGLNVPAALVQPIPPDIVPIDPSKAAGLGVAGATGGLTHPACIAETARRASEDQPPPNGDFPCVVPISNGVGVVDGVCFVHVCKGISAPGLDGFASILKGISSLGGIVNGILSKLLQGGSSAPDSPVPVVADPVPPVSTPLTSNLISTDSNISPSIDISLLLTQSAVIVRDLLRALNPQVAEVTNEDQ